MVNASFQEQFFQVEQYAHLSITKNFFLLTLELISILMIAKAANNVR